MTKNLFETIREKVKEIPEGKVATYGQIAKLVGLNDARKTGWAIRGNQDTSIPCHRVVFADGSLAENYSMGGKEEQRKKLEVEGIDFGSEDNVDLEEFGWKVV